MSACRLGLFIFRRPEVKYCPVFEGAKAEIVLNNGNEA